MIYVIDPKKEFKQTEYIWPKDYVALKRKGNLKRKK